MTVSAVKLYSALDIWLQSVCQAFSVKLSVGSDGIQCEMY